MFCSNHGPKMHRCSSQGYGTDRRTDRRTDGRIAALLDVPGRIGREHNETEKRKKVGNIERLTVNMAGSD